MNVTTLDHLDEALRWTLTQMIAGLVQMSNATVQAEQTCFAKTDIETQLPTNGSDFDLAQVVLLDHP